MTWQSKNLSLASSLTTQSTGMSLTSSNQRGFCLTKAGMVFHQSHYGRFVKKHRKDWKTTLYAKKGLIESQPFIKVKALLKEGLYCRKGPYSKLFVRIVCNVKVVCFVQVVCIVCLVCFVCIFCIVLYCLAMKIQQKLQLILWPYIDLFIFHVFDKGLKDRPVLLKKT